MLDVGAGVEERVDQHDVVVAGRPVVGIPGATLSKRPSGTSKVLASSVTLGLLDLAQLGLGDANWASLASTVH